MTQTSEPGDHDVLHGADAELADLLVLLDDASDLAAVVDLDGKVLFLNRAARRLLLTDHDLHTPISAYDLVSLGDHTRVAEEIIPTIERDGRWSGNLSLISATGLEIPTRTTMRRLPRVPGRAVRIAWVGRDLSTEKAIYERLHKKIFEDELTGLPHRSIFLDRLDLSLRRSPVDAPVVTLLFISLDRFKDKNDRFGREIGDDLLRTVASRLAALQGPSDTVSRWGGDEFVFMREGLDVDASIELGSLVAEMVSAPTTYASTEVFLSASIGIATSRPGVTTEELLRQAESAGQLAKRRGGDAVQVYDQLMQARALRRAEIEDSLRGAIDRDELVMFFQPEVSLRTNEIIGAEGLLRWQHPEWGLVSPAEFVPVAEASNLILEVGAWVLLAGMEQCAAWRELLGSRPFFLGINISARQWSQDDFVELVATTLARTGAEPADICLEITESVLMEDLEVATETLRRLKALGLRLAIDDFGTGYSSLSYLRRFPIDVLKVDQSFVSGLGHDREDSAIVQAVVSMGRAMELLTVAEGVETAHQVIELRELSCDIGQGYHYARPQPAEMMTRLLEAGIDWSRVI